MAIATRCPHCGKGYSLKNELIGKRVTCNNPNCKKVFAVESSVAAAPSGSNGAAGLLPKASPNVEDLALSALADEAVPTESAAEPQQGSVAVKCQFCDHENQFEFRFAGKNAPCQNEECRKIIKVPLPKKTDPKDWRTVQRRPSAAKVDPSQLEGAWGNVEATAVGREAIVAAEADRVEEEREPRSWGQLIKLVLVALAGGVIIIGGASWVLRRRAEGQQQRSMEKALALVKPDAKAKESTKLRKEQAGLVHLMAGRYQLGRERARESRQHLLEARGAIDQGAQNSPERSLALIETAVLLAELAGTKEQAEKGTRLEWDKGQLNADVRTLLQRLPAGVGDDGREMRSLALRRLIRVLAASGHIPQIIALVNGFAPTEERGEQLGVVGLELLALGHRAEARKIAEQASLAPGANPTSLVALWLALASPEGPDEAKREALAQAQRLAAPPSKDTLVPLTRTGYAKGWAHQGRIDEARKLAWSPGKPEERFHAAAQVAAVVMATRPGDVTDLEQLTQLLETELKNQPASPWLLYRLTQFALQTGKPDLAARFADRISDPGLQSWARLELLRHRLTSLAGETASLEWAKEVGEESRLAFGLAVAEISRHNAAAGSAPDVAKWENSAQRAFGFAGIALAERP